MIQSTKYAAVNWTDGMKISEKHLIAHDDFLLDAIRDTNSLRCNNFNYGLLPVPMAKGAEATIFEVLNTATNDVLQSSRVFPKKILPLHGEIR